MEEVLNQALKEYKKQMKRQFYAAVEEVFDMSDEDWEAYEKEIENPYDL